MQELIHAYRVRGHLMADTNPLEVTQRKHPDLDINLHGLTLWDLEREFPTGGFGGKPRMKLRDILGVLRDSYCRTVGTEYMHIQDPEERRWLQARIEVPHPRADHDEQIRILSRLNVAEAFEMFLQTKFVGQRRFSLEGAESLIPLVDAVLAEAADADLDEAVIGMAHRGRLNVLANIVGKSYGQIFKEFEGNLDPRSAQGSGDVKYHLGAEGTFRAPGGRTIKTSLVANPSHLEAVDPVLEGVVRAKQDVIDKGEPGFTVLPVLIHGDAAFAGQGVVAETLNLSLLRGYRTGGTVHIIVNNQVGFTTAPQYSRSSVYATDVARMIQAPIFHVNGDDPEAVVRVARLAFAYRQAFKKDVVVDMLCYRKRGHNETDNPSFTQPLMYDLVEAKRSTRKVYTESLIARGDITMEEAEAALRDYQQQLERAFTETRDAAERPAEPGTVRKPEPEDRPVNHEAVPTAVSGETVKRIIDTQVNLPADFTVHPRLKPLLDRRAAMAAGDAIDWATGELLAFGALVIDGHPVRLVGQDSRRGTFGQRHAVLVDRHTGRGVHAAEAARLRPGQVLRARLAAVGVRGDGLRVRVLRGPARGPGLLGGPVRRLRRRRADDHRRVHQLRRAEVGPALRRGAAAAARLRRPGPGPLLGPDRAVPLAVRAGQHDGGDADHAGQLLPPAALAGAVRPAQAAHRVHPEVHAPAEGGHLRGQRVHHRVVPAADRLGHRRPADVRRVLLCTGKVYYDLAARRQQTGATDVAIVRVERLYPLPVSELTAELARYPASSRSPGCRRSRPTWAPGRTSRSSSRGTWGARSAWCRCPRAPRPRRARRPSTPRPTSAARDGDPVGPGMYFTDRGIEELADRRGDEQVTVAWLAERLRDFVDLNPDFETAVDRLATWLARLDDEEDP